MISLVSCSPTTEKNIFSTQVEQAHQKELFTSHEAIQFDIELEFGGKMRLDATITTSTNSAYGIIKLKNGEEIYIDHNKVFCSPNLRENKSVRFDAYTWSYFFLFPYKLNDEGTIWSEFTTSNNKFNTGKLNFGANIGDAPDDWYIVYANATNNLIDHAAYIVTANKTKEAAEKDPHAIQYLDYKNIDGVPFAHKWFFWGWQKEQDLTKQLGSAEISNIQFITGFKNSFNVPKGYISIKNN